MLHSCPLIQIVFVPHVFSVPILIESIAHRTRHSIAAADADAEVVLLLVAMDACCPELNPEMRLMTSKEQKDVVEARAKDLRHCGSASWLAPQNFVHGKQRSFGYKC